jgi:hypothetical protein
MVVPAQKINQNAKSRTIRYHEARKCRQLTDFASIDKDEQEKSEPHEKAQDFMIMEE